ncbi:helix-turn-helix transcriptional regulator [Sinisalibacter aestuarii]|uniref:AraC family transcriptional regulator n=1 Tax=Sinisalibacter aestuarii TaxID=2949426 RepID=A0ABQ5LTF2_9RHOB|nr:AraC family transcriptional regulator [Sinisalibacter aestuarii]GKY87606.1 AraC family transcriptional regulator [Sinisalibacter aestuarii]
MRPVSTFLSASPHAEMTARADLGFGLSAAIWTNRSDEVRYTAPLGHTFSYYLEGGDGTWRTDIRPVHGHPGAVSVLPEGQSSDWDITGAFEFVHLYLPDAALRRSYAETFDRDARLMPVEDLTYATIPALTAPFRALASALRTGDALQAEAAAAELVTVFFTRHAGLARPAPALGGGLAPRTARRLRDFIEAHLDTPIRLADLGTEAGLSAFHLHRAFRTRFGVSPQAWIAHRRVARAKALIRDGEPLAQVAAACGYANQSHFSRSFRDGTGMTPGAYRRALGAAAAARP